ILVGLGADPLAEALGWQALRLYLLLDVLSELHAFLGRHAVEGLLGRRPVVLRRQLRSDLLVALQDFLIGVAFLRRSLLVPLNVVLKLQSGSLATLPAGRSATAGAGLPGGGRASLKPH